MVEETTADILSMQGSMNVLAETVDTFKLGPPTGAFRNAEGPQRMIIG